jgi:hypothetical protein
MFLSDKKFIDKYSFFERNTESYKIMKRDPDRIPVICEKNRHDVSCPEIDKHKYLVPYDITVGQFIYVIRKRIRLPSSSALFLFVGMMRLYYLLVPKWMIFIIGIKIKMGFCILCILERMSLDKVILRYNR